MLRGFGTLSRLSLCATLPIAATSTTSSIATTTPTATILVHSYSSPTSASLHCCFYSSPSKAMAATPTEGTVDLELVESTSPAASFSSSIEPAPAPTAVVVAPLTTTTTSTDDSSPRPTTITSTTTTTTTTTTVHVPKLPPSVSGLRVAIRNVGMFWADKDLAKLLVEKGLNFKALNKKPKKTIGTIIFETEEDKAAAIASLTGTKPKDCRAIQFAEDFTPYIPQYTREMYDDRKTAAFGQKNTTNKRKGGADDSEGQGDAKRPRLDAPQSADNVITPWAKVPYEEQLARKEAEMRSVLHKVTKAIDKVPLDFVPEWLAAAKRGERGGDGRNFVPACPLEGIRASPLTTGYRNKNKFTVALDEHGTPSVGFRMGSFVGGSVTVGDPSTALNLPHSALAVAQALQNYIRQPNALPVYNVFDNTGYWRFLIVRNTIAGEVMAIVQVAGGKVGGEVHAEETRKMRDYLVGLAEAKELTLSSLFVQSYDEFANEAPFDCPTELLYGTQVIHEKMLGLTFQISPKSFFQVNTPAAEVLYSVVRDYAAPDSGSMLLDVCCGTGTIGLTMAASAKIVVGNEIIEQAIEDAYVNAKLNGVSNVDFVVGKAETEIGAILAKYPSLPCVAVVDPPRSGLHPKVLRALRNAGNIQRLVYVSCNPNALVENAVNLCAPNKKRFGGGTPFVPTTAVAVDLFPHTEHTELVVVFERLQRGRGGGGGIGGGKGEVGGATAAAGGGEGGGARDAMNEIGSGTAGGDDDDDDDNGNGNGDLEGEGESDGEAGGGHGNGSGDGKGKEEEEVEDENQAMRP